MKMTEKLILKKKNHTAFIVIKNPPANTWDLESLSLLQKIIDELNESLWLWLVGQAQHYSDVGCETAYRIRFCSKQEKSNRHFGFYTFNLTLLQYYNKSISTNSLNLYLL